MSGVFCLSSVLVSVGRQTSCGQSNLMWAGTPHVGRHTSCGQGFSRSKCTALLAVLPSVLCVFYHSIPTVLTNIVIMARGI